MDKKKHNQALNAKYLWRTSKPDRRGENKTHVEAPPKERLLELPRRVNSSQINKTSEFLQEEIILKRLQSNPAETTNRRIHYLHNQSKK